jgi:hypothetical protein
LKTLLVHLHTQQHADIGTTTRHSHLHGVAFPVDSDALDALVDMKSGKYDYIQLVSVCVCACVCVCVCAW